MTIAEAMAAGQGMSPSLREVPERKARWEHLTEGICGDKTSRRTIEKRWLTETMLDNMKAWAYSAAGIKTLTGAFGVTSLTEESLVANVNAFTTFAYPLVRRVYPRLISTEIFTVQPMTQPTGKIFYLDFKYGTTGGGTTAGDRIDDKTKFNKDYANSTEGGTIKEINWDIADVDVTAEQKKLKAIWSIEAQQDLFSYHGLDAEAELMAVLADELVREIDQTLISDALANVGAGTVTWNAAPAGLDQNDPVHVNAYAQTLYSAIVDANNLIYKKRYRNANWIVTDVDTAGRLEKLNGFQLADLSDSQWNVQHGGRQIYGTLKNRWVVYKDPWFPANTMLLGYKGDTFLDAGYVYSPYVPFYVTPSFTDPNDMKPRRGMMSRYGKKMVVSDMFSKIAISTS